MTRKSVNLIVLNYNAKELLKRFLPSIVREAGRSRHACRVTVLDNASTDGSAEFVLGHFPGVTLLRAPENRVLCSFNEAVAGLEDEIVFLLNNDMEMQSGFVDPLVEVFLTREDAFFAASHGNRALAGFRWGILEGDTRYPGSRRLAERPGATLTAGVAAFDRAKFLELGGYDALYLPGRYEDVDLCFRGWKRGWRGYYVPESRQIHEGETSFKKVFGFKRTQRMVFRNSLLFMIKNVSDPWWTARWLACLPMRLGAALLTGKFYLLQGFADALARLPQALRARRAARPLRMISDREVLLRVNGSVRERQIRRVKGWVDLLARSGAARAVFSAAGFWTLRFWRPAEFLLLRELSDCRSVLDLGCGRHSIVPILPSSAHTTGVELFKPHLDEAAAKGRHDAYLHADLTQAEFADGSFDAVVMLDVLEHLPKEVGEAMLAKMSRWARKKVVIFTPNGFMDQHEFDENPLMEHRSGWTARELSERGFRVHGVRGFKILKRHQHGPDGHEHVDSFWDWTQVFAYHLPGTAFQLFAVKDKARSGADA